MADADISPLDSASATITPLPPVLRRGLPAIAALACLSFVTSSVALIYLTIKFTRWYFRTRRGARAVGTKGSDFTAPVDLSLGLAQRHFAGDGSNPEPPRPAKSHPNQFLILIFNLLLADIHQAGSFMLNAVWYGRDGIFVGTTTCWAQGWLIQTGDLASSFFITAIAVHTYLAVVWKYRPPQMAIYIVVVSLWIFNFVLIIIGIAITDNGKTTGGFFVRATAWCWINVQYEGLRLYIHYLWIFLALAITGILYTLIFLSLHIASRRAHSKGANGHGALLPTAEEYAVNSDSRTNIHTVTTNASIATTTLGTLDDPDHDHDHDHDHPSQPTKPSPLHFTTPLPSTHHDHNNDDNHHHHPSQPHHRDATNDTAIQLSGGHHKAFLLYPLIYILCTAPLALGRIATMAGVPVPLSYFCTAGALITSNGWLDVLLWGVTRRQLLFGGDVDTEDTGLDTFAFMRTPPGRKWGNMVWVEGGNNNNEEGNNGGGMNGNEGDGKGTGFGRSGSGRSKNGNGGNSNGPGDGRKLGGLVKRRMGWRPLGRGRAGVGATSELHGANGRRGAATGGNGHGHQADGSLGGREDGMGIQMDLVTTVVVEPAVPERVEGGGGSRSQSRHRHAPSASVGSRHRNRTVAAYDTDSSPEDGGLGLGGKVVGLDISG